jgi:DDE superfamily endonuclease
MVVGDESGCDLRPGRVRTYAPCGPTPVRRWPSTCDHVSVMSGLPMDGRLYTPVRDAALDRLDRVLLLRHLVPHVSATWLVIWEGSPIHQGEVRTCLADGGAKPIHVEQLPPDAPDLNPGAGVWQYLTQGERRHLCCRNLVHLRRELDLAMKRLRRKPHVVTACVAGAG